MLLYSIVAFSKCKPGFLSVWPHQKHLNLNPVIVIDALGFHPKFVKQALVNYPTYLQSDNDRVPLLLVEYLVGSFQSHQVVLKPSRTLIPNKEYRLDFDSLPTDHSYNLNTNFLTRKWVTQSISDDSPPELLKTPTEKGKELTYYGCGPAIYVDFRFQVKDESQYMARAALTQVSTGETWVFYLSPTNRVISIGHGMCAGEFNLELGAKYEVEFSLMDASGNHSKGTSGMIAFTAPSEQTPNIYDPENPPPPPR